MMRRSSSDSELKAEIVRLCEKADRVGLTHDEEIDLAAILEEWRLRGIERKQAEQKIDRDRGGFSR